MAFPSRPLCPHRPTDPPPPLPHHHHTQWAFIAINGTQQMYVYETSLARIAERRRWIEESVNVFQGDFTLESDKAHLVDVVLGLYGLAVVVCKLSKTRIVSIAAGLLLLSQCYCH